MDKEPRERKKIHFADPSSAPTNLDPRQVEMVGLGGVIIKSLVDTVTSYSHSAFSVSPTCYTPPTPP
ncbi:hypothetical protein CRUP_004047 [Coryphaenoides rupestris]|nr:hypothetical protein CRUP_004047 [Coryphaenoides rupestris]